MVENLKVQLIELQPTLKQAAEETAKLLEEVAVDQQKASEVQLIVQEEETKVSAAAREAQELRDDAQKDLDEAMPAFEAAVEALKSLNKQDITEVKSFTKPPDLVMKVMEAVCLLKGVKPTWEDAKKLLSQPNFLRSLETYDKDSIPPATIRKLQSYIKMETFTPDEVKKVCHPTS